MLRHLRFLGIGAVLAFVLAGHSLFGQGMDTTPVADQFNQLHFRSIGPASMSGRITDFAVYEANPAIFYVGSAHGGLWKTTNNGATFTAEFQHQGLMSIGDVTVSQKNPDLVWVGTGEGNNRQSISWGDGVFKSTDGGKTFKYMGLGQSYHINRIVIDPDDNNVVLVAAQGSLFGPGGDRGVYKTTDGGATWKQVLKVDADTGANDLAMAATDHRVLYASTYQRRRSQCCFNGGGPGSGIWKSTDGGDTWTRLEGGLPKGSLGRIGLDVYQKSANIVYASLQTEEAGGGRGGRGGGGGVQGGAGGEGGLYRTDDGGETWRKVSSDNPRPMYFSQVRVDPNNPDVVYMGGVGLQMTVDGGKDMETDAAQAIHDDVHAIWIDPANSDHLMIGDDGGVAMSYDQSRSWIWLPNLPVGLFYHVGYDMEYPFNVCGGMQDNYDWCGPSAVRTRGGIAGDKWHTIQGGDGFVAIIDQRDSRIVYSETQDGNMMRHNTVTGEAKSIRPSPANVTPAPPDNTRYRWNWDTPMIFSPEDPGTLYVAAQMVFKSTDRGDSWTAISPDLTTDANRDDIVTMGVKGSDIKIQKDDGISAWPTIVSLAESPKQAGLYYTGTDDGVVSVSKDGGKTWDKTLADRMPGFPKGAWVSEVVPSRYDAGTVYVTVDAHRIADYDTHIWVSNDFGATFRSLNGNLKGQAIKTLTEDQRNPDVLYVGAETGIFLSLDRGKSWQRLKANFPDVRVDEITLHPRDNAMIVATHGRALWILDHLEPIQEYTQAQTSTADATLFTIPTALEWKSMDDRNDEFWGQQYFMGENPPFEAVIQFYLKKAENDVKLKITDAAGKPVRELTVPPNRLEPGIETTCWDLRVEPIPSTGGGGGAFGRGAGGAGAGGAGAAGRGAAGAAAGRGGGGRGGRGNHPIEGVPGPQPEPGYDAVNPCGGGGGGFGGGGRGGGGGNAGPYVMPGTYTVALMVGGKTIETKPMKVVLDPAIQMTDAQRKRYNDVLMDLHQMQGRGVQVTDALNPVYTQMTEIAGKLKDAKVPATVQAQFDALTKDLDAVRPKFGVPPPAGGGRGGRGGGFGGRGAADPNDLVARAGQVKGEIMAFSEMPSDALMKQYTDVKVALPKAIADANAFLVKAMTMSQTLKKYNITLNVPAPIR
jgi:photosystem II stability/assembly factor-like uncharacterized protein